MTSRITSCTHAFPLLRRPFSTSIKKTPTLENVDDSCVWQQSHPYISKEGKNYEIVLDFSVSPRRNTYKGRDIIEKKIEIDPHFRSQVETMKKLAYEKLEKLCSFDPNDWVNPNWYLKNSLILNLIEKEPLISKNGKRFECNAWVHNDHRRIHAEKKKSPEYKLPTIQITDADKLQEVPLEVESHEAGLPCFHPWETLPDWLKEHSNTSLVYNKSAWKHPSGSQYVISLWVHSIPEETSEKELLNLSQRIRTAGQPLKDQIKGLKELAAERLSQVLELRKPPICIAAVKAAMIAEGTFPLCTDVHITENDIFELSAHVSMQPEQEAREVNEALKNSAIKCRSDHPSFMLGGAMFKYRPLLVGPAPDNILEGTMWTATRVEATKCLLKLNDEGNRRARQEIEWLDGWERLKFFSTKKSESKD